MNNKPIGVFDSGLGGLTAVKQIMKEFPNESVVYFGDTGRVPYGTKSPETILQYTRDDINFVRSFDVKMIIIACGTASSQALPMVKYENEDIPITGVVDATVYAAVRATKNKKIGVIGTVGTIKSGAYEKLIYEYDKDIEIHKTACPLFVPLVETGHFDTPVTRLVIEEYLEQIRDAGVDTLILGCTHYPLLKKAIGEYMGDNVVLIDPCAEVVKYLKKKLGSDMLHSDTPDKEQYRYFVSDDPKGFAQNGSIFLEKEIDGQVEKIDIEKY
ncbi:MAG: glutamate racemase [Clostridia bacterium]|nr:glutamate racemase [Clostridia bacterium]